tara:strand:+ start:1507 stop:1665 length:159 start_codon:yes stop_codon:yes gene_type:complete
LKTKNKKNKEEKNRNISDKLSKAKRASGYKAAKAPPKKVSKIRSPKVTKKDI